MLKRLRSNPLWYLFFEDKLKNTFYASLTLSFNLIATLLEGVSFAFILFSFTYLSGETPTFFPSWLKEYLADFGQVQIFSFFMLGGVIAQILRSTFTYFGQMVTGLLTVNLQTEAQRKTYYQIFHLTFASVNRYKIGDLIHNATAPPTYFRNVTEWLNRAVVSVMMIIAYVILMVRISFPLTCYTLILSGGVVFLQKTLIKKIIKASQDQTDHLVELNKETAQNVSALRTIHLYNQQAQILKKMGKTLKDIASASTRLNKWNQLILPLNEVMGVVLVGTSMILGQIFLNGSNFQTFPILLTFLALTYRLGTRLQVVMSGCGEIAFNMGLIERLKEILQEHDKEFLDLSEKPISTFQEEIHFDQVSLKYRGKKTYAIRKVSFIIPKGKIIAFVGSSGGGKSSLLDLLLRLYDPTEGNVYVDGKSISAFSLTAWRELFGMVSQDPFLFHETIASNIRYGKLDATEEEIVEAAILAGAHTFIEHLPKGYQTMVGERGHKLSGGERQRISLARALVRKPEILVLDEATSSLDSQSEQMIQKALEKLRGKTTMLIVAHRLATINMADQIIMLDKGCIIEQGTHAGLIKLEGRYHHFWSLQTSSSREERALV